MRTRNLVDVVLDVLELVEAVEALVEGVPPPMPPAPSGPPAPPAPGKTTELPAEELARLRAQQPIPSEDAGPGLFARYARREDKMGAVVVGRAAPEYVALLTEKGLVTIKANFEDLRAEWWDGIPEPAAP